MQDFHGSSSLHTQVPESDTRIRFELPVSQMRLELTLLLLAGAASGMINSGTPDGVPASFDCALRSLAYDYGRALLPGRGTFRTLFDLSLIHI